MKRELKFALERFWKGGDEVNELLDTARELRMRHWKDQAAAGMNRVAVGDFSLYDHVLDMSARLGNIPSRFAGGSHSSKGERASSEVPGGDLDRYFRMARGRSRDGEQVAACEMTKWFDTNYHYMVPEFSSTSRFSPDAGDLKRQIAEARDGGCEAKPVLLGPVSYLSLGKVRADEGGASSGAQSGDRRGGRNFDKWSLLPGLVEAYRKILGELAGEPGVEWVQIDEPVLALDLSDEQRAAFTRAYASLSGDPTEGAPGSHSGRQSGVHSADERLKILVATYFAPLRENLDLVVGLPVDGIHLDAVRGEEDIERLDKALETSAHGKNRVLSLGLVDGRNIWKSDLTGILDRIEPIAARRGESLWISGSCSLLHVPIDLEMEDELDSEIAQWMAFAKQKLTEIETITRALREGRDSVKSTLEENAAAQRARRESKRTYDPDVRKRLAAVSAEQTSRSSRYAERAEKQRTRLKLPLFPTTTIGSFPQTPEIRRTRREYKRGNINLSQYQDFLKGEIDRVIREQEEAGLDVLVHGEPERNDMVEYFGEQLSGYAFTKNGWVQSYGSRCVKPPIIYGDVSRPEPMTVEWISYAQSKTRKPVKGMLTGPITMMKWAFVRDDQDQQETSRQIALALRDEVLDLEAAGIAVIQVDEAALREALPLRRDEWAEWLERATENFRLATSGVSDGTQIHTHMCYSEFNSMIHAIADLDADVITIEAARSNMELLDVFNDFEYPNEIGPGVYDIHSPNVPDTEQIVSQLNAAAKRIPIERLWVNPDCGLKTRGWEEVRPSLKRMVEAAKQLR